MSADQTRARAGGAGIAERLRRMAAPKWDLLTDAASHIEAQDAEIARLRAALESIGGMTMSMCLSPMDMAGRMQRIANAALAPKEPQP